MRPAALAAVLLATSAASAQSTIGAAAAAAQKGVNWVVTDAVGFTKWQGCIACHRQGAALYGAAIAKHNGFQLEGTAIGGDTFLALAIAGDQWGNGGWYNNWGGYANTKTGYALYGLAGYTEYSGSTSYLPNLVNGVRWAKASALATGATGLYLPGDHWSPPTTGDWVLPTAQAAVATAVAIENSPALADAAALRSFLDSLASALEAGTDTPGGEPPLQHLAYRNIGLVAAGRTPAASPVVAGIRDAILAAQNPDGGWGWSAGSGSDPLFTGQALYALCMDGVRMDVVPKVAAGVNWLVNTQVATGYWNEPGHAADLPTVYATLALGCYGTLNVGVTPSATGGTAAPGSSAPQQLQFGITVTNTGYATNTYAIQPSGGVPGSQVAANPPSLTLAANTAGSSTITVKLPPNLPDSTVVPVTVNTSYNNGSGTSVQTTTYTVQVGTAISPSAPATSTSFVSGAVTAFPGQRISLAAKVASGSGAPVTQGSLTFYVGKAAAGTVFADADGAFRLSWVVPATMLGGQTLTAAYAGFGMTYGSSAASASLTIPDRRPAPVVSIALDPTGAADGDSISFDVQACPPDTDVNVYDGDNATPIATMSSGAGSGAGGGSVHFVLPLLWGAHSLSFSIGAPGSGAESFRSAAASVTLYPAAPAITVQPATLSNGAEIDGSAGIGATVVAADEQDESPAESLSVDSAGHFRHLVVKRSCNKRPSCHRHRIHYRQRRPGVGGAPVTSRLTADTPDFYLWDDAPGALVVQPADASVTPVYQPSLAVRYTGAEAAKLELPAAVFALGPTVTATFTLDGGKRYDTAPVQTGPIYSGPAAAAPAALDLTMATPGAHKLEVAAKDNLGNADAAAATSTFVYGPSIDTDLALTKKLLEPLVVRCGEDDGDDEHDEHADERAAEGHGAEHDDDHASLPPACRNPHLAPGHYRSLVKRLEAAKKLLALAPASEHAQKLRRHAVRVLWSYSQTLLRDAKRTRVPQDLANVLVADVRYLIDQLGGPPKCGDDDFDGECHEGDGEHHEGHRSSGD